ncbi:Metallo-dependent hydrolase [Dendrothele bispora CBS 962.96]|uniref:Metallo-dependent hydrolase n=1 Tax=Dendrothele bispora (strain CBS 962.96) TaxID=1314807 RepID=A0A4S8MMH7_DENBC|nr:Metallo-dependent hydrolase [Dendrothele bispora CBS 962.96]
MIVIGNFVHCPSLGSLEILKNYLLVTDDSGLITHFEDSRSEASLRLRGNVGPEDDILEIDDGSFFLPTFCDLHLHAPQFLYQGNGLHLPLMKWLNEYAFKAEEKMDADPVLARRVYTRLVSRLIQAGTGSVLLFGTIREETNLILAEVLQSAGIRGFVGKLSMDISSRPSYIEASTEASLGNAKSFVEKVQKSVSHLEPHRRLVEPVLTPRFVPTCTNELLNGLGELAQEKSLMIQSHLAEAHDQVKWVREERGEEDFEIFRKNSLLTTRTVQAHCTFLDVPSLSQLHVCGTSIAHCPLSNAYFSTEPFRLREALDQGVKVGLGTDIAGGYSIDIMNAMRQAVIVSRMRDGQRKDRDRPGSRSLAIDWKEFLYLATMGGAVALGLHPKSGMFQVGAPFDAQLIKLIDSGSKSGVGVLDFMDLNDARDIAEDMVEKWWCIGDDRNRISMWIQGIKIGVVSDQN